MILSLQLDVLLNRISRQLFFTVFGSSRYLGKQKRVVQEKCSKHDDNAYPAKLIYLNFHLLEVVSRYRDPQLSSG